MYYYWHCPSVILYQRWKKVQAVRALLVKRFPNWCKNSGEERYKGWCKNSWKPKVFVTVTISHCFTLFPCVLLCFLVFYTLF